MFRTYLSAFLICFFVFNRAKAQHIYYKNPDPSIFQEFADTANKLSFVNDSLHLENNFKYVLRFFPKMEYEKIKIIFKPGSKVARVKPSFSDFFKSPDKRTYKIYFSNNCNSTMDSVILKNLRTNSQLGLIARQIGHVHDLSTDGFFDFLAWRLKQSSKKAKRKLEHENELKILELGLGYQLLSLSRDEEEKLKIEKWKNAKGYAKYVKSEKNKFMNPQTITNFISDMPVYVSHKYQ
jgi:hypothetical protein